MRSFAHKLPHKLPHTLPHVNNFFISLLVPVFSSILIFLFLSYLMIPPRLVIPMVIIFAVLIFGLIRYYSGNLTSVKPDKASRNINNSRDSHLWNKLFICSYIILLSVVAYFSNTNTELFIPWEQVTAIQILQLTAAIALSLFFPGYAIVSILTQKVKWLPLLPKLLTAYIISFFIIGCTSYINAIVGFTPLESNRILLVIYGSILGLTIYLTLKRDVFTESKVIENRVQDFTASLRDPSKPNGNYSWNWKGAFLPLDLIRVSLVKNYPKFLVFGSLFALVVLFTYFLYGGVILVDQWFHHGRALEFQSGTFREATLSGEESFYTPFLSGSLGAFFTLSGLPSVNAYASLNFLNIMPVFAYYYFFTKWVPSHRRRAALMASVLFALSGGFGWIYLLDLSLSASLTSHLEALDIMTVASKKSSDIYSPSSFIGVEQPSPTSPLIIIALPAGLLFLGMMVIQENKAFDKIAAYKFIGIAMIVLLTGIFSHYEFQLFIIITVYLVIRF